MDSKLLKSVLSYDPSTGDFTRLSTGKKAGTKTKAGYFRIGVNYRLYLSHRLAWLYQFGELPDGSIDHVNGDPSDNRIDNLRLVDHSQNGANSRSKNKTGFKGVYRSGDKFCAQLAYTGTCVYLGTFDTAEDAHVAWQAAHEARYGEFSSHAPPAS